MATNKSDEQQALAVTYERNQPVVIAFNVEHDTLVSNERSVSVSCLDIGRRLPFGSASQGIPSLKRGLGVRVLLPKGLERCDGYDSHCPIMVPKWDQRNPLIFGSHWIASTSRLIFEGYHFLRFTELLSDKQNVIGRTSF
jgi:hypothetical protein